jgi:hypothetical protein
MICLLTRYVFDELQKSLLYGQLKGASNRNQSSTPTLLKQSQQLGPHQQMFR